MANGSIPAASTEQSLLLEVLNRMGVMERQNIAIAAQNELIIKEQQHATESRRYTHRRIDSINEKLGAIDYVAATVDDMKPEVAKVAKIAPQVDTVIRDVAAMQPVVNDYKTFKQQMAIIAFFGGGIVTGSAAGIWYAITHWKEVISAVRYFFDMR